MQTPGIEQTATGLCYGRRDACNVWLTEVQKGEVHGRVGKHATLRDGRGGGRACTSTVQRCTRQYILSGHFDCISIHPAAEQVQAPSRPDTDQAWLWILVPLVWPNPISHQHPPGVAGLRRPGRTSRLPCRANHSEVAPLSTRCLQKQQRIYNQTEFCPSSAAAWRARWLFWGEERGNVKKMGSLLLALFGVAVCARRRPFLEARLDGWICFLQGLHMAGCIPSVLRCTQTRIQSCYCTVLDSRWKTREIVIGVSKRLLELLGSGLDPNWAADRCPSPEETLCLLRVSFRHLKRRHPFICVDCRLPLPGSPPGGLRPDLNLIVPSSCTSLLSLLLLLLSLSLTYPSIHPPSPPHNTMNLQLWTTSSTIDSKITINPSPKSKEPLDLLLHLHHAIPHLSHLSNGRSASPQARPSTQ